MPPPSPNRPPATVITAAPSSRSPLLPLLTGGGVVLMAACTAFTISRLKEAKEPDRPPTAAAAAAAADELKPQAARPFTGAEVNERLLPSTAFVVKIPDQPAGRRAQGQIDKRAAGSLGSGILVSADRRLVLTNNHVAARGDAVAVFFPVRNPDGSPVSELDHYLTRADALVCPGVVVASKPEADLSLIELRRLPDGARAVPLASEPAKIGQRVYSIGNSGVGRNSLWRQVGGAVTTRGRRKLRLNTGGTLDAQVLETDAPINPGDSGGPVVDEFLRLVGVVSNIDPTQRGVSGCIDVTEVRTFLTAHAKAAGFVWADAPPHTPAVDPGEQLAVALARLTDGDPAKRAEGVRWIGRLGSTARPHAAALLAALDPADPQVEAAVAEALGKLGPPQPDDAPALARALAPDRPGRTVAADWAGSARGTGGAFAPALLGALPDADTRLTEAVTRALDAVGPPVEADIPAVAKAFRGPKGKLAVKYAAGLKAAGRPFVPYLLDLLPPADADLGVAVGDALDAIGPPAADAAPALARAVGVPGVGRSYSVRALAVDVVPPPEAVGPLVGLLSDPDTVVRKLAATAVGRAGTPARADGLAGLLRLTADPDPEVKAAATAAVDGWKPFAATDRAPLEQVLADKDGPTAARILAGTLLADVLKGQDFELASKFGPLLDAPVPELRRAAVVALSGTPRTRREVRGKFDKLLADPDPAIRLAAVQTVTTDTDRSDSEFELLVSRLSAESNPGVKAGLIGAVCARVKPTDRGAVRVLLQDGGAAGKTAALDALAKAPPTASDEYAEQLKAALTDTNLGVRAAACRVYAVRGPKPADLSLLTAAVPGREAVGPAADALMRAAVEAIAAGGPPGRTALLELLDRSGGSFELRRAICRQLASGPPPADFVDRVFGWAEQGVTPPDEAGDLLAKAAADQPDKVANGLVKLANLPEFQGRKQTPPYKAEVRKWVVGVYAKLDPTKLPAEPRRKVGVYVRDTAKYDPDAEVKAAAKAEEGRWK